MINILKNMGAIVWLNKEGNVLDKLVSTHNHVVSRYMLH